MKFLLLLALVGSVLVEGNPAGGKSDLTAEDLDSENIKNLAPHGVAGIKKHKEDQNSLPSCVDFEGVILSGTKQVVAGMNYDVVIKITPFKSSSDDCAAQNVDLSTVPVEHCTVNIWAKPVGGEKVVTVSSCAPPPV